MNIKGFVLNSVSALFVLSLTLTACGSAANGNAKNNEQNVSASSGNAATAVEPVTPTPAAEKVVVADGRDEAVSKEPAAEDTAFAEREFAANEAKILDSSSMDCDDGSKGMSVLAAVSGSFTKAGVEQKALLYEYCRAGRSFGIGGVIIAEGNTAVAHYAFGENGLFYDMSSIKNLRGKGIDAIVLSAAGSGQGYSSNDVSIFEFTGGKLDFLGSADTYESNSGAAEKDADILTTAYRVSVQTGSDLTFYRDTFEQKGGAKDWKETSKGKKFELNKETPGKFVKIL
jgi:hypothetical protein